MELICFWIGKVLLTFWFICFIIAIVILFCFAFGYAVGRGIIIGQRDEKEKQ